MRQPTNIHIAYIVHRSTCSLRIINRSHYCLLLFRAGSSGGKVILATYTSLPALGAAKAFYWISWEHQMMTVGIGNILGENTLLVYGDQTLTNIYNITLTFNTSLSLSFGYYFGNTGKCENYA